MKYKIELTENWRPDRRSFFTPGVYRVPEDFSETMAERAVKEGGARRLESSAKFPAPKPKFTISNKIAVPPENKQELVGAVRRGRNRAGTDAGSGGDGDEGEAEE